MEDSKLDIGMDGTVGEERDRNEKENSRHSK